MAHSKWAVLPDVHNKTFWAEKTARKWENQGFHILFLGDYFDSINDTQSDIAKTAQWLAQSLQKPNRVHLLGNHDAAYAWPNHPETDCPGWAEEKQNTLEKEIGRKTLPQLKLFHVLEPKSPEEEPVLCSHAGIHLCVLHSLPEPNEDPNEDPLLQRVFHLPAANHLRKLEEMAKECTKALEKGVWHPLLHRGHRIGENGIGGIFWQDLNDCLPIPHLPQIIGHNRIETPHLEINPQGNGYILHLDSGFTHLALVEPNNLSLEPTARSEKNDLPPLPH